MPATCARSAPVSVCAANGAAATRGARGRRRLERHRRAPTTCLPQEPLGVDTSPRPVHHLTGRSDPRASLHDRELGLAGQAQPHRLGSLDGAFARARQPTEPNANARPGPWPWRHSRFCLPGAGLRRGQMMDHAGGPVLHQQHRQQWLRPPQRLLRQRKTRQTHPPATTLQRPTRPPSQAYWRGCRWVAHQLDTPRLRPLGG